MRHIDGNIVATWQLEEIEKRFKLKVTNMLLVKAQSELIDNDNIEYFYYDRARLLFGETSKSILKSQFENEQLLVDLRLHDKGTSARNHGTGFRIYESNLENIYKIVKEFEF